MTDRHIKNMVCRVSVPESNIMFDEETEEYSEDFANLTGEIADLTKTAKTPGGISLFEDEAKTTYKSTYDILQEISKIYNDLSDKNRAQLLEKMFGKTRAQTGAAILTNFEAAERAMSIMENSAGNADKEMEVIQQSLSYKINALKETWVGLAQEEVSREFLGGVIEGLTSISELVVSLIENFGSLGAVVSTALGTFATIRGLGKHRSFAMPLFA